MSIMFTINSWSILVPLFLLFSFIMVWLAKFKKQRYSFLQYTFLTSFVIYLLAVIHLVYFPIDVNIGKYANQTPWYNSLNLIPIITIDIKTFLLNILMLIPFGMYLPIINTKLNSLKKAAQYGLLLSLSFEIIQLLIRVTLGSSRSSDINDLIANVLGSVLGYLFVKRLLEVKILKSLLPRFSVGI